MAKPKIITYIGHELIPTHKKLDDAEKKEFFEKSGLSSRELPKILINDPTLVPLKAKLGDVIKIERPSPTAGVSFFYRVVIDA